MNKELTEYIFKQYPALFKHRGNFKASLMMFGFENGDGWFGIINDLCHDIQKWYLLQGKAVPDDFYVMQVKEKYGSLSFYITAAPQEIHDLIREAEKKSYTICEDCGRAGKYRDDLPWIRTLCDDCLDKEVIRIWDRIRKKHEDFISTWQKEQGAPYVEE